MIKRTFFSLLVFLLAPHAFAASREVLIPSKNVFTVSDGAGGTLKCAKVGRTNVFVVMKGNAGFITGKQAIANLSKKIAKASGKTKKKLKKDLANLKAKVKIANPLCARSGGPGTPDPSNPDPETPLVPTTLEKLSRPVTPEDVFTLVDKAGLGMGPDEERLLAKAALGIDAVVDEFMTEREEPAGLIERVSDRLDGQTGKTTTQTPAGQRQGILDLFIHTKNPYAERMATSLLGVWTVGGEVIEDETFRYVFWDYYTRLRNYTHGQTYLPDLAVEITRDPLMLIYLNGDVSTKAHPNENYGRELMELFTLGPTDLDGAPNYTETRLDGSGDIPTASRLLTGWTVKKDYSQNKLVVQFDASKHDSSVLTMFSGKPWQFSAQSDEELVRGIFANHPAAKFYYAKELLKLYLTPNPPRALVEAFGAVLAANGYKIRPAMRVLLTSGAFYDSAFRNTVPSDPYVMIARSARVLRLQGSVNVGELESQAVKAGFVPNLPPSVFWYPQSAWSSSSILLEKANTLSQLLADSTSQKAGGWSPAMTLPTGAATLDAFIDFVVGRTGIGKLGDAQRQTLTAYMTRQLQYDGTYAPYVYENTNPQHQREKGLGLYFLVLMSPRFQLL